MLKRLSGAVFVLLVLGVLACPALAGASLPLRVQMVLARVAPLLQQKDFAQAAALLAEFQARGSGAGNEIFNHPEINFTLGNCWFSQKQYREAKNAYQRVLKRAPEHFGAWQNLAACQYENRDYKDAAFAYYQAYLLSEPKNPRLCYYAAVNATLADQPQRTIALFDELLRKHPEAVELSWRETLIHALLAVGEARRALPQIIILAAGYEGEKQQQWREILLYQYLELEMPDQALALARNLSREQPANSLWWKGLAHIHLQAGRYQPALGALVIYSLLVPLKPQELKLLADLYLQEGIPVQATGLYQEFLTHEKDAKIVQRLVQAYLQQGKADDALKMLDEFKPAEKNPLLSLLWADLLYELRRYKEAALVYERVGGQDKSIGRAWLMAGYCYWQLEDFPASRQALLKALADKKQQQPAQQALQQISRLMAAE